MIIVPLESNHIQYDTPSVQSRALMSRSVKNDISKHRSAGCIARLQSALKTRWRCDIQDCCKCQVDLYTCHSNLVLCFPDFFSHTWHYGVIVESIIAWLVALMLEPLLFVSAVSAHVVGEDEAVMKAASAKDLVLKIWHSKDGPVSDKPPARVRPFAETTL